MTKERNRQQAQDDELWRQIFQTEAISEIEGHALERGKRVSGWLVGCRRHNTSIPRASTSISEKHAENLQEKCISIFCLPSSYLLPPPLAQSST